MRQSFIYIFFSIFFINSLWSQQIKDRSTVPANALVYALPSTLIEVSIQVIEDFYQPGPYASYAEAYLTVDEVPTMPDLSFSIGEIEVRHVIAADYDFMYYLPLGASKNVRANYFALSEQGLIFTNDQTESLMGFADLGEGAKPFALHQDRLPSSPMESQKKSNYDRIKTEKGFTQVPYQYSVVNAKDPERKAEEASKFIYSLRQRRFELITGDVEHAFNGNSLQAALDEIKRLEEAYLSLFIGKSTLKYRTYKYYINPEAVATKKSYPICRFSSASGILSETNKNGRAIALDITPEGKLKNKDFNFMDVSKSAVLYYRIPDTAKVELTDDGDEICVVHFPIYQMGKIVQLPSDALLK